MEQAIWKRAHLCALFLALLPSCTPNCNAWALSKVETCCDRFNSTRISYDPDTSCSRIELELLRDACGTRMYINTFSVPIPCKESIPVLITVNGYESTYQARPLLGGQRFLLPDDARDYILQELVSGNCIEIKLARFRSTISPKGFYTQYCKALR